MSSLFPTGHFTVLLKPYCTLVVLDQSVSFKLVVLGFNKEFELNWKGKIIPGTNDLTLC